MIRIEKLTKTFEGFVALNRLDLHVKPGSIYGLVGVNGSGKTTVIKHLAGIYRQDDGAVTIGGQPVYDNAALKATVGYIPDDLYFFPHYTIGALRRFYKNLYACWDDERFRRMIGLFKLDDRRRLGKLSKGMQKQAAFAFAMAIMPSVMLLDEPIDGLDPIVRKTVMQQLIEDVATRGMTVLISSHNLKDMEGICDAVGIMQNGTMTIEQDLDELKADVHKLQVALPPNSQTDAQARYNGLDILRFERRGSVDMLVVRGKADEVAARVKSLHPLLYDALPLSLEEIFYIMGEGDAYAPVD